MDEIELDRAIAETIELLKLGKAVGYDHDLHPRSVCDAVAFRDAGQNRQKADPMAEAYYSVFEEAAWELAKRGIVRPGVKSRNGQTGDGGGYSLTAEGHRKLPKLDNSDLLLTQPGSLAKAFQSFQERFGGGFAQRSQEALKCRNAEAWLACCAMAGAAAESVLLATAIEKTDDEKNVLDKYGRAGGRKKVLDMVNQGLSAHVAGQLRNFSGLILNWRDEAAHGKSSRLSTANADEALRTLLHMCQWVEKEWDTLTLAN